MKENENLTNSRSGPEEGSTPCSGGDSTIYCSPNEYCFVVDEIPICLNCGSGSICQGNNLDFFPICCKSNQDCIIDSLGNPDCVYKDISCSSDEKKVYYPWEEPLCIPSDEDACFNNWGQYVLCPTGTCSHGGFSPSTCCSDDGQTSCESINSWASAICCSSAETCCHSQSGAPTCCSTADTRCCRSIDPWSDSTCCPLDQQCCQSTSGPSVCCASTATCCINDDGAAACC